MVLVLLKEVIDINMNCKKMHCLGLIAPVVIYKAIRDKVGAVIGLNLLEWVLDYNILMRLSIPYFYKGLFT